MRVAGTGSGRAGYGLAVGLLGGLMAWSGAACGQARIEAPSRPPTMAASRLLGMLGMNVHLEYNDGRYADAGEAIADLDYLGIHRLRDGTPEPRGGVPYRNYLASIRRVAEAGNRFEFIVGPGAGLGASLEQIDQIAQAHPGAVEAIEGPNEINNWPVTFEGLQGETAAKVFQAALYAAVRTDPSLASLPVLYFTGGTAVDLRAPPRMADLANVHPYPNGGDMPGRQFAEAARSLFAPHPGSDEAITETGYVDLPPNANDRGVNAATVANLTLDAVFDAAEQGFWAIYFYQLRTAYPDPKHDNPDAEFGMFDYDNRPKPVAVALHNLTTLVAAGLREETDLPGPGTKPALSVSGLPPEGHMLLLTASNSVYDLVLWAEPVVWNARAHEPVRVAAHRVTIGFAQPFARALVYDPVRTDAPLAKAGLGTELSVTVSDHPVIVQFKIIARAT